MVCPIPQGDHNQGPTSKREAECTDRLQKLSGSLLSGSLSTILLVNSPRKQKQMIYKAAVVNVSVQKYKFSLQFQAVGNNSLQLQRRHRRIQPLVVCSMPLISFFQFCDSSPYPLIVFPHFSITTFGHSLSISYSFALFLPSHVLTILKILRGRMQ